MRIVFFSRFPRFDRLRWKGDLFRGLCDLDLKPRAVIYDGCAWSEQASEALRRFGRLGVFLALAGIAVIGVVLITGEDDQTKAADQEKDCPKQRVHDSYPSLCSP